MIYHVYNKPDYLKSPYITLCTNVTETNSVDHWNSKLPYYTDTAGFSSLASRKLK